jgi:GAF domain-containing protein
VAELETESPLRRQLDELREQQRAVSDVLRAVAQRKGLQPVLDEIVEATRRLCDADTGGLWFLRDDLLHSVAHHDREGGVDEYDREYPHTLDRSTMVGRVAVTGETVHIPDADEDPEYHYEGPRPYRAMLGSPVVVEDELIGVVVVVRREARPFGDEQIELIKTFADQAAIAIANARLIEAVERQLEQQRAISDVFGVVARAEGLDSVFAAAIEAATRLCKGEYGGLYLLEAGRFHVRAHVGMLEQFDYEREHPHAPDRRTLVGRVALTQDIVHIPDLAADPEYDWPHLVEAQAGLAVPIFLDAELIGVLGIVRQGEPFPDDQMELVKTFADQAAIAIANARLIDAVERQLEQQRAIADVLGVVARGEGLEAVFEFVLTTAGRLCAAEYGQICLADGDVFRVVGTYGTSAELEEYERAHPTPLGRATTVGRVGVTREVVHIPDVREDPEYSWGAGDLHMYRAMLGVPIFVDDELIGVINVVRNEPGPYSNEHIELVKTFADQAAIAIANARLMDAVRQQLEQQQAVGDILRAVARSEGLDAVFNVVADEATRLCSGDYGALYLREGDVLVVAAQRYRQPELDTYERENPHPIDRSTAIGRAAVTRDVVHIADTHQDPEYSWGGAGIHEFRGLLAAPILLDDELIGAMNVVRVAPEPFAPEHIELIKTFADQAAIAIANARLLDAVERQRTELSRFVSPQVAELVSSEEGETMLGGHRAYISCLFCDLRGFTAFAETAAPEELFDILREYHVALGSLIPEYEGTLEHFAGDGMMVFFNDPIPVSNHELAAVRLALDACEGFTELAGGWRKRGIELGLGIGIAAGYATLGRIGFEGRYDYGALGPVTNLASRLSTVAKPGQILIDQRVFAAVEDQVVAEPLGERDLKGFGRPVIAYEVSDLR